MADRRVALVCGGSKGIGRASAAALLGAGHDVVILSRSTKHLAEAAKAMAEETQFRPHTIAADVGDPNAAGDAIGEVIARFGRLDILVNNAGGPPPGSFLDHPATTWREAFEQNLLSVVEFTRHGVPHMRARGWGRVVNITTTLGKEPTPGMVLSATLRAGVAAFTKATAKELATDGITVNNVCPNAVATDRSIALASSGAEEQGRSLEEILSDATAQLPIRRLAEPHELGGVVAFLASEAGSYVSGVSLMVDAAATGSTF